VVRLAVVAATMLVAGCGGGDEVAVWEQAPSLAHGRAAHVVVSDGTTVWALGGTDASGAPVLQVERLDGGGWKDVATLPGEGLNASAAAFVDGRIYVIGGFGTTTNVATEAVHAYDVASGRWTEAAPLPEARGGHAAAVLEGKIHVVGGGNAASTLDLHSVYDPASDSWSEEAPLRRPKGSPAAVVHEGKLWLIGGRSGLEDFGEVEIYEPATDTWTSGPPIPPRGTHGGVVRDGSILVVGGESQSRGKTLAEVLRLESGKWVRETPLPAPRAFARTVLVDGAVLVVGGSAETGSSHASEGSDSVFRLPSP
jgi:N-acetylneuraminic acid mutarotase